jgi:Uma2 family endonuclease
MIETGHRMSVESYLEHERGAEIRHEFVDGRMIAMAGESRQHYTIARNITRALEDSSSDRRCEIIMEAIKVRVQEQRYRYPDVVVSCDPGTDRYFLENPCFLVEVLSESTADTDHDKKLEEYMQLQSVQRYLIVSQRRVIVYKRATDGWRVEILSESGEVEVPCLETTLSLDQIYAGLQFSDD